MKILYKISGRPALLSTFWLLCLVFFCGKISAYNIDWDQGKKQQNQFDAPSVASPSFVAFATCANDQLSMDALPNTYFIEVRISTSGGNSSVAVSVGAESQNNIDISAATSTAPRILVFGPFAHSGTGLATQNVIIQATDGTILGTAEVAETLCAVDTESGLHASGIACVCPETGDLNAAGLLFAQATPGSWNPGTTAMLYLLVDETGQILGANHTGLFTAHTNGNYTVYAYNFLLNDLPNPLPSGSYSAFQTATTGACSAVCAPVFYEIDCVCCPTIAALLDLPAVLCDQDETLDLTVELANFLASQNSLNTNFNLQIVVFTTAQTGNSMYTGGQVLATVSVPTTGSLTQVSVQNIAFPPNSTTQTYFVYAILENPPANLACRPFAEAQITVVAPQIIADAGAPERFICVGESVQLSATGGQFCQWSPSTALDFPNTCNPIASPSQNTTYVVTVSDALGCTASDTVAVFVHNPSALVCNNAIQISLDEHGMALVNADMVLEGTSDADAFYTISIKNAQGQALPNPLACAQISGPYEVKIMDNCSGNSCWGSLSVEDKLAPNLVCSDVVLPCILAGLEPSDLQNLGILNAIPTATDNCGVPQLNFADVSELPLDCTTGFSHRTVREWVASDAQGNTATCIQTIDYQVVGLGDVQLPTDVQLSCENALTTPNQTGMPFFLMNGNPFLGQTAQNFCSIKITHSDQTIPICDGTVKILRTWTILDGCKPLEVGINPTQHIQTIKVQDTKAPIFVCPENQAISTDANACTATFDLPDLIIEDACSQIANFKASYEVNGLTKTLQGTLENFTGNNLWAPDTLGKMGFVQDLPLGKTTFTYTVTDDCGNASSCSFQVDVQDEIRPTAICDEHTIASLGFNGQVQVLATIFDDGSFDNCSQVYFKARRMAANACDPANLFDDVVQFCCSDLGQTVQVVVRVYDKMPASGAISLTNLENHSSECMVEVTVQDKLKPVCQAPTNVTVECAAFDPSLWAYGQATPFDNCCVDTLTTVVSLSQFDTLCNKGSINRTFTVTDCGGLSSTCQQKIQVDYTQDYFIQFPDDVVISACSASGDYGKPLVHQADCELIGMSYKDEISTLSPDACYTIERTWKISNWCTYDGNLDCIYVPNPIGNTGPIVSSIPPNTQVWSATNAGYQALWSPTANCYIYKQIIKILDDTPPVFSMTEPTCDLSSNNPDFYQDAAFYDAMHDSHDLCEGLANLSISALDSCSGADIQVRYLLFLDTDNDGSMETVINSQNAPATAFLALGNALNPSYSGGDLARFDKRQVPANQLYRFGLKKEQNGTSILASVAWKEERFYTDAAHGIEPELPYGTHKIKWFVADACGNESVQEQTFSIEDCKKPTVICKNGLSINLMNTSPAMVQVWASDVWEYGLDNCTPADQLKFGICAEHTNASVLDRCTGTFPLNADGSPDTLVTFDCAFLGAQVVQVWVMDKAGNADFCQATVSIQDNANVCSNVAFATIAGQIEGAQQSGNVKGLEAANVDLTGTHPLFPPISQVELTNEQGSYDFSAVPTFGDYTLSPVKDDDHLNGVNTYDLLLIQKHLLGAAPLTNPYTLIAADVNKTGSITPTDIIELRKLILGIYPDGLPQNTSWRFVDKAYVFSNPENPFAETFAETIQVAQLQAAMTQGDFKAIKIGDINDDAVLNQAQKVDDRRAETLYVDVEDKEVKAGEVFTLDFEVEAAALAFQFTLLYEGLEVENIVPKAGLTEANFAHFSEKNALTVVSENGKNAFSIQFKAEKAGQLRNLLRLSSSITKVLAFNQKEAPAALALRFDKKIIQTLGFEVYQNKPNPFHDKTLIGFNLPTAKTVSLRVYDELGRTILTKKETCAAGYNSFLLTAEDLNGDGVFYYEIGMEGEKTVRRMLRL